MGFLYGLGLLGIGAVAWPIYLHLERRRDHRIQVVPSLRLFMEDRVPRRRRRLQDLGLLLARCAVLVALFALISQPILTTSWELPLPRVEGGVTSAPHIVLVVDDGLPSRHFDAHGTRLEQAKTWLAAVIGEQDDDVRVALVPASYPRPTAFVDKARALALVDTLECVPRASFAAEALSQATVIADAVDARVFVAAPRDDREWDFDSVSESLRPESIAFFDTSSIQSPYIERVDYESGRWVAQLHGEQQQLVDRDWRFAAVEWSGEVDEGSPAGPHLQTLDGRGGRIDVAAALLKRLSAAPRSTPPSVTTKPALAIGYRLSLPSPVEHPWLDYWFTVGSESSRERSAVLVIARAETSTAADSARVMAKWVESWHPEIDIVHRRFDVRETRPLPPASAVVIISSDAAPLAFRAWLEQRLGAGAQILCLPDDPANAAAGAGRRPSEGRRLPLWGAADRLPAVHSATAALDQLPASHRFDELLVANLETLPVTSLRRASFADADAAVVLAIDGRPLLSVRRVTDRGCVWALGLVVDVVSEVPIHPLFAFLVDWILFPRTSGSSLSTDHGARHVEDNVAIHEWFDVESASGELYLPSGRRIAVASDARAPQYLTLEEAGIYTLVATDATSGEVRAGSASHRIVNETRPPRATPLDRSEWRRRASIDAVTWFDPPRAGDGDPAFATAASSADTADAGAPGGMGLKASITRQYDLSGMLAALLLFALVMEGLSLFGCWRGTR